LIGDLAATAVVNTIVGFMESIAVAKVYARRHRYEVEPNTELIGLGTANVAAGFFGGYPITGGFSRTVVNDTAGARTPLASLVTAAIVPATIAFFTPLLTSLPNAALGAVIVVAVIGLIDIDEMRHVVGVKRSDLIGLSVALVATLALGIEIGIGVAVVASMLVVFARMSTPHTAVLGHVEGTTSYRNVARFPEAETTDGIRIVRIDAAGAEMLADLIPDIETLDVSFHLAEVKGPVRDVMHRAGLWEKFDARSMRPHMMQCRR
jgi:SulP family sulfate permease